MEKKEEEKLMNFGLIRTKNKEGALSAIKFIYALKGYELSEEKIQEYKQLLDEREKQIELERLAKKIISTTPYIATIAGTAIIIGLYIYFTS